VHRAWTQHPDISADLTALQSARVCVVCSGAKSILDLPATVEALQTLSVPVIGYRSDGLAQFYCRASGALDITHRCDEPVAIATLCRTHWSTLGQRSAVLVSHPVPDEFAMNEHELESVIEQAEQEATDAGITGPARTPRLLHAVAEATAGRSLEAHIALLLANAALAGSIATALAEQNPSDSA